MTLTATQNVVQATRLPLSTFIGSGNNKPTPRPNLSPVNPPGILTPFIGRKPELDSRGQLLRDPQCRLLTLNGPGGIGKICLAIEIAGLIKDIFPDGVWFVSLALFI